ncbi:MAG: DUF4249 family protein [Saprospiraceae bacterium]|uniref:DUF4249 family protein n=1 Tax=Candidatus Defluviibacterium haderslevense TaxID=2981993 RepID=A0A9D7SAY1_9BACT|nr:DUF4249 family protein [Candidatus Defluviibacterium haderslevense]
MKINNIIIILCLSFFSMSSCQKDIIISPKTYIGKLSIVSLITPNEFPKVYVYQTVPYFDPKTKAQQLFKRDVSVKMNGTNEQIIFQIDSIYNIPTCEYFLFWKGDRLIQENTSYNLEIIDGNKSYKASANTHISKVALDSVTYVKAFNDVFGEHEGVVLHFKDKQGEENYYRYKMNRFIFDTIVNPTGVISPCSYGKNNYVSEIGRTIYNDKNLDGQPFSFVFEPTYKHKEGQEAFVILQSVDKNIYTFFDNIDRSKIAQYNPFVEPVFIQPGQFGTDAIGVFGAYVSSDSLYFEYPE